MGLAPYGDPARFRSFFEQAVELRDDGSIRIPMLKLNQTREERENYIATRAYLDEHLIPRRAPDQSVNSNHEDVAAALQECLERVVLHVCGHFGEETGLRRIALAGGVALNCTANGKLTRSRSFRRSLRSARGRRRWRGAGRGALSHRARAEVSQSSACPLRSLGRSYSATRKLKPRCNASTAKSSGSASDSLEETCAAAAKLIADGRVIAWSRGRMEYGPRALGNRSILADPGHPEMRDRINAMVKKREAFRPFAPACSVEEAHRWFEVAPGEEFPYMISVVDVRPEVARPAARDHARERLGAPANRQRHGQSRFSCAAPGRGQNHGPPDGAEYQLQCERAAHRQYAR